MSTNTSLDIRNRIIDFYAKKTQIYNLKIEYIDSEIGIRYMKISYYRDQCVNPINKLEILVQWKEVNGLYTKSDENCISMRTKLNQFGIFQSDELEFFDRMEMRICDEATSMTGQLIEDWWGDYEPH